VGVGHAYLQAFPLIDKLKELAVNDPYSRQDGHRRHHHLHGFQLGDELHLQPPTVFSDQPDDVLVLWVYALLMDKEGNHIKKPMPACTGLRSWPSCATTWVSMITDAVAANTKVRLA
jgi:oleate hydratase